MITQSEIAVIRKSLQWAVDNWALFQRICLALDSNACALEPQDFLAAFRSLREAGMIESAAALLICNVESFPLFDFLEEAAVRCIARDAEDFIPRIYDWVIEEAERQANEQEA